ncbi:hypothetical protein [Actinotalea sp.]|uniref:hypothetical protein n=1 Tax=Actinotalea sp. TaxID=1872145 RepID=UPI00356574B2
MGGVLGRWLRWVSVGELLGFCVPTAVFALTVALGVPDLLVLPAMVLGGLGEGLVLGWSQSRVLREVLPVPARRWTVATGVGGAVAWALGMAPSTFVAVWTTWPVVVIVLVGAVIGLALLLSIGLAQWTVLRRHLARARWWVLATALAWGVGLGVFGAVTSPLWRPGQGLPLVIAIGLLGGALMAVSMAATTGVALRELLRRQVLDAPAAPEPERGAQTAPGNPS